MEISIKTVPPMPSLPRYLHYGLVPEGAVLKAR